MLGLILNRLENKTIYASDRMEIWYHLGSWAVPLWTLILYNDGICIQFLCIGVTIKNVLDKRR